jgi:hypothetical protein
MENSRLPLLWLQDPFVHPLMHPLVYWIVKDNLDEVQAFSSINCVWACKYLLIVQN